MSKVYCAASDCKWNSVKNQCAAKEIHLADNYVMTVYDGRQHFNKCHEYEMSEESKRLQDALFAGGDLWYSKRSI